MTPWRGSQLALFGLNARGNEEGRAEAIGLAPVGRPKTTVGIAPLSGGAGALEVTRRAASAAASCDRVETPPVGS